MQTIVFATTSSWKIKQAEQFLSEFSIGVRRPPEFHVFENDLYTTLPGGSDRYAIEIQSDSFEDVASYKAFTASKTLGIPLVVEDSGVTIDALKGFPGTITKYAILTIGVEGVLRLMAGKNDRRAKMISVVGYCAPKEKPRIFVGVQEGVIETAPHSRVDNPWKDALLNPIFAPTEQSYTLSELMPHELIALQSYSMRIALTKFGMWFRNHGSS